MKASHGHIGKQLNNNMINWFTYEGLNNDMSAVIAFQLAQILAVLIGGLAFGAMCYGLVKFYTRER